MKINKKSVERHLEFAKYVESFDRIELLKLINQQTDQNIPDEVSLEFSYTGLSNMDFLTSSYLPALGYKNILS